MLRFLILLFVVAVTPIEDGLVVGTPIVVRPTDIDSKGHVNNARFVEYLQFGRWQWLERHDLTEQRLADLGAAFVVVNLNLDYRAEVKFGETVTVNTQVEKIGTKSVVFSQEVKKADGTVALAGKVTLVLIDVEKRKSRELGDQIREALVR